MSIFSSVPVQKVKRNKFNMSQERLMTAKFGKLYPCMLHEVVPGDSWRNTSQVFLRTAPQINPTMARIKVHMHFFFVPHRLVWDNWEDFVTGGEDGLQEPVYPTIQMDERFPVWGKGSLADYFGLPTAPDSGIEQGYSLAVSALPFRAYQLIYNEYYRDQNLIEKVHINKTDGAEDLTDPLNQPYAIRTRAYAKDYFTAALPWPQRGGEAVVPLGSIEPNYLAISNVLKSDGTNAADGALSVAGGSLQDSVAANARIENLGTMTTEPVTIETLRTAFRVQEWLEKSARGGSRYIEAILSHYGVVSSDARLQRPEFLGGQVQPVTISEVLNTAGQVAPETTPQDNNLQPVGAMAGHGISAGRGKPWKRYFEEHGYIIGIMSILPQRGYMNGVHRMWRRFDKFDHYWPTFARLGEQAIQNMELYKGWTAADSGNPTGTFGYIPRYAEYKYACNSVHGDFRDNMIDWHLSQNFGQEPALNQAFIEADDQINDLTRIFAVTGNAEIDANDYFWIQMYHKTDAIRPMPYHAIPTI